MRSQSRRLGKALRKAALLLPLAWVPSGFAQEPPPPSPRAIAQVAFTEQAPPPKANPKPDDIFDLDLEKLGKIEVKVPTVAVAQSFTTPLVSGGTGAGSGFDAPSTTLNRGIEIGGKVGETVFTTPAAIYVLTSEDILRSGMRTFPDLLRMVPGMDVAQFNKYTWAVSSRGFNSTLAGGLQVLHDGRSIYSPLFGGTLWDNSDVMFEDIERIESIRGPGGTLWGFNAVNGIVNVITKNAKDTQGWLVTAGTGSDEPGMGSIRYGDKVGENFYFRVWTKYTNWDNGTLLNNKPPSDGWAMTRGGFRADWTPSEVDTVMFQGDIYSGFGGGDQPVSLTVPPFAATVQDRISRSGGFLLNRWTHTFSDTANASLQFYYDRTERNEITANELRETYDLDFQFRFEPLARHQIICGVGDRISSDSIVNGVDGKFVPARRSLNYATGFVQDDFTVVKDKLHWINGVKFVENDFTGFEVQPSSRLLYTPNERQTFWAAVSRAVQIPNRSTADIRFTVATLPPGSLFPFSPPASVVITGNPNPFSVPLLANELGTRLNVSEKLSLDLAGYYNIYRLIGTIEPQKPFVDFSTGTPQLIIPQLLDHNSHGDTYGAELAANAQITDWWKIRGSVTWWQAQIYTSPISMDMMSAAGNANNNPHNQASLRSFLNLPYHLEFDTMLYYVDSLQNLGIPSYVRLDLRLGWRPTERLECFVDLQNLLENHHTEFNSGFLGSPTRADRAIYGMVRLKF